MRALIDTCIIIDALQEREPFAMDAKNIFISAANNIFIGYITAKAATDIYYLMHRYTHSDKTSRETLNKLFTIFNLLDTSGIDCQNAILSTISDFEDAVMAETAIRSKVDCIITRNTRDFSNANIPIYSPKEFSGLIISE